jgi:hypothetical protein
MNTGGTCTCTTGSLDLVHTVPYKQSIDAITHSSAPRARHHQSAERRRLTRDGRLRAAAGPRRRFGAKEE